MPGVLRGLLADYFPNSDGAALFEASEEVSCPGTATFGDFLTPVPACQVSPGDFRGAPLGLRGSTTSFFDEPRQPLRRTQGTSFLATMPERSAGLKKRGAYSTRRTGFGGSPNMDQSFMNAGKANDMVMIDSHGVAVKMDAMARRETNSDYRSTVGLATEGGGFVVPKQEVSEMDDTTLQESAKWFTKYLYDVVSLVKSDADVMSSDSAKLKTRFARLRNVARDINGVSHRVGLAKLRMGVVEKALADLGQVLNGADSSGPGFEGKVDAQGNAMSA